MSRKQITAQDNEVMYVHIHFCDLNINKCNVKCNVYLIMLFDYPQKKVV